MAAIKNNNFKNVLLVFAFVILANAIGNSFFYRFDLTKDKRYTLSPTSLAIIKQIKEPLAVKIYMQGDLPAEFKRLQQ